MAQHEDGDIIAYIVDSDVSSLDEDNPAHRDMIEMDLLDESR